MAMYVAMSPEAVMVEPEPPAVCPASCSEKGAAQAPVPAAVQVVLAQAPKLINVTCCTSLRLGSTVVVICCTSLYTVVGLASVLSPTPGYM